MAQPRSSGEAVFAEQVFGDGVTAGVQRLEDPLADEVGLHVDVVPGALRYTR